MLLTNKNFESISTNPILISPSKSSLSLPEKVLQFGTGVLLRGLCDQQIHQANCEGVFNGRIVVVKSTSKGDTQEFDEQNGMFTLCVQGLQNGNAVKEFHLNTAISRVLTATREWEKILDLATSPELQLIVSNTTEVGISLVNESITAGCPSSFPAKLLGFLYHRFKYAPTIETVVVPTELIVDNGKKLKAICLELVKFNNLDSSFLEWLEEKVFFCSSLVDRIVPGKPDADTHQAIETQLGYKDNLLCMAEAYNLWAIEGNEKVKSILSFESVNDGVVIAPSIELFRELKLRLLNGTHTLTCGLAYLKGMNLVRENMKDDFLSNYVKALMLNELAMALPENITENQYTSFGNDVLSRFSNPFINHKLLDITVQYTAKMVMRNIPLLLTYHQRYGKTPPLFALGFAAYLRFMKADFTENGKYFGKRGEENYPINCDAAPYFYQSWKENPASKDLVHIVLSNKELWGTDLTEINGFEALVLQNLEGLN